MKIKLLPLSLQRTNDYLRWFNDKDVRKYLLPDTPKTKKKITNWIIKTIEDNTCYYFSIFLTDQKIHIGHIGVKKINQVKKQAEIGIVIGERQYWRKGIGTIAFLKLLEKIKNLKLKKIFAKIDKSNIASIKFFSKLGFKKSTKEEKDLVILVYQL